MSATATADDKIAFTSQIYNIEYNYKYKKVGYEGAYAEAKRILQDIKQYEPWAGAGLGPALGGWEGQDKLLTRTNYLIATIIREHPEVVAVPAIQRTLAKPPPGIIAADPSDCRERALDMFGPIAGRAPGAQTLACHYGKIAILASILGVLVVMGILSPYANLLSKALGKKKKKKNR